MGQKWLLDLNQRSENPWRDLFLWAVLLSRHEMATYFWAMVSGYPEGSWVVPREGWGGGPASSDPVSQGQEGVAAALAACKILKEMSHLETEAEAGRTQREAKYEQLALGEPLAAVRLADVAGVWVALCSTGPVGSSQGRRWAQNA